MLIALCIEFPLSTKKRFISSKIKIFTVFKKTQKTQFDFWIFILVFLKVKLSFKCTLALKQICIALFFFYFVLKQILDLLAQQSAFLRDRQLLSREVEFLRKEIAKFTEADLEKFFSSNKTLVDDIIKSVNCEEMEKKYEQKSVLFSDNKMVDDKEELIDT